MKKLTIEQKAAAYDEAIARVENIKTGKCETKFIFTEGLFEHIFPELKESESEDEKIRKGIIRNLEYLMDRAEGFVKNELKERIAWLEKQGEKGAKGNDRETPFSEQPIIIIPKFRVGDEIKTTYEEPLTITKIDKKGYWSEDLFICGFGSECIWDLVEKKPAEWSDEDEKIINKLMAVVELYYGIGNDLEKQRCLSWLKSLRPQNHWKPSELQIEALESATANCAYSEYQDCLRELIEQLKKLK